MRKCRKFLSGLLVVGFLLPNVVAGNVEAATATAANTAATASVSASSTAGTATAGAEKASATTAGASTAAKTTTADNTEEPAYVPGEAIVCFKTEDAPASKSEKQVKQEVEASLEKDAGIDDAEALIAIDDADAVVEAVEEAEQAAEEAGAAEASVAGAAITGTAGATKDSTDADDATKPSAAPAADPTTDANTTDASTADAKEDSADPAMITLIHSDTLTTDELLAELRARDDVLYAEPNYLMEATASQDYSDLQWGLTGTYGIGDDSWNTYSGDTPTPSTPTGDKVIAIIDSGVDYTHEDLKDVMWNEGLNYPSLVAMGGGTYGFNSAYKSYGGDIYDTKDPLDQYGHGTHCAGIMVAAWNKMGVSGVTSGAKLMAVKVANEQGNYPEDAIVRGFQYVLAAKKAGVNVVATNNSYSRRMQTLTNTVLVQEAGKLGIVCVYSAGNDNQDLGLTNNTSAFTGQAPNALVIGASTEEGKRASFSNYSTKDVHVFAPGENIMSTVLMQTGRPQPGTELLKIDGQPATCDYSARTETEDPIFALNGTEENFSIKTAEDSKNVLHVESKTRSGSISISTKVLKDLKDCKGGYLEVYSDRTANLDITVFEQSTDEMEEEVKTDSHSITLKPGVNFCSFRYVSETDDLTKENVRLRFEFYVSKLDDPETMYYDIDIRSIGLCSALENYEAWSGTSMAAPMVTGAIAILAERYPNDSAAKLAARVTGSVMKTEDLSDKCISGGIFRLDKVIIGDTVPVPQKASVDGTTLTVEGFFFGADKGNLTVGGKACTVKTWSDEKITAELPQGYTAGENVIEVTSSIGSGRGTFMVGKAANLYPRLPLPGSTATSDGLYTVNDEAKAKYEAFYKGGVKSMIALDGSLYAFVAGPNGGTSVYRYQITEKKWDILTTSKDYTATDGVTLWNGKILITAEDDLHDKTAIGTYDVKSKKLTWKVINTYTYQRKIRMINNGYGIFLIGGIEASYGDVKSEETISTIRRLDPATMKVTELEEEAASLSEKRPVVAATEDGTVYVVSGEDQSGSVCLQTLTPKGNTFASSKNVSMENLLGNIDRKSFVSNDGIATKNGILLFGPVIENENGTVVTDSYLLSYDGKKATKQKQVLSQRATQNLITASWNGTCYVMGMNPVEEGGYVFASVKTTTLTPYGLKAQSDEWVNGIYYGKDGFRKAAHPYKASWKTTKNGKQYVDTKGNVLKKQWAKIDGKKYYFKANGCMAQDEFVNGRRFNKNGTQTYAYKYHWRTTKKGKRFIDSKGNALKKQWATINGKRYYFKANGYMACSEWIKGKWFGKNGLQTRKYKGSWKKTKKGKRYVDTSGWYAKNRTLMIDGKTYKFDKKGYVVKK